MTVVNAKRVWIGGLAGGAAWIAWGILVNFVFLMPRCMAAQDRVFGAVDLAHPAFAKLFCDLIMPKRLADHGSLPSLLSDGACYPQQ